MWIIYAFLSAIFAALVTLLAKAGLNNIDPTLAAIIRAVIIAVFLIIFGFVLHKYTILKIESLSQREWILIIMAGLAGALSWLFYFLALSQGSAGAVAAIDRMSLIFIVIFSVIIFGDSFNTRTIAGTILLFAGILFISLG